MAKQYWLMKSEPSVFSIDDLRANKTEPWDGVRNYQARNFMRDQMQLEDEILFYHSNCHPPGIAGLAVVAKTAFPDFTAWDPKSKYYDPKSTPQAPRWVMVEVRFKQKFHHLISLNELKGYRKLQDFRLLQKGNRLSIMPVNKEQFSFIVSLAHKHSPHPSQ